MNAQLSAFQSQNRILLRWKELFLKDIELKQIRGEPQTVEEKMTASEFISAMQKAAGQINLPKLRLLMKAG
jgi:hypothetical protein